MVALADNENSARDKSCLLSWRPTFQFFSLPVWGAGSSNGTDATKGSYGWCNTNGSDHDVQLSYLLVLKAEMVM